MTSDEARIGPAVKAREAEVVEVLAAAFDADVVYRQLLPDTRRRARALGALFRLAVADATQVGAVEVAAAPADRCWARRCGWHRALSP